MSDINDLRCLLKRGPASAHFTSHRRRLTPAGLVGGALSLLLAGCPGDDGVVLADGSGSSTGADMATDGSTGVNPPLPTATDGEDESTDDGTSTGLDDSTGDDESSTGDNESSTGDTAPPACGDGVVDDDEECDDAGESESCNADCTAALCGDGLINESADETCDDEGESETCNDNCTTAICGDGVANATAGEDCDGAGETAECNNDCTLAMCGDGVVNTSAAEQCDDTNADDFDHCSNECLAAPAPLLDADHIFDTDTGELDGIPQTSWDSTTSTWYVSGLEIQQDAVITVVGTNALTIDSNGLVLIEGTIDGAGQDGGTPNIDTPDCETAGLGGQPGPGGFAGGDGGGVGGTGVADGAPGFGPGGVVAAGGSVAAATTAAFCGAGGGGGGHLEAGTPGAGNTDAGAVGGIGGEGYLSLPPLIGGGGGGGGSIEEDGEVGGLTIEPIDNEGAGGGGGGGAIAIVSATAIVVTGTIDVSGGAGGSDNGPGCSERGHGGGGAGGAIQLLSPSTDIGGATLDVSGGLGGTSDSVEPEGPLFNGGDGSDGRIDVPPTGFGACVPKVAGSCAATEACLTDDPMAPTIGVCSFVGCVMDSDCPTAPGSGSASSVCADVTGDGAAEECILDCSGGESCPAGMDCFDELLCVFSI